MALLRQTGEGLAGRIESVNLYPFDVLEAAPDETAVNTLWNRGGFPGSALAASDADSFAFRNNLIRTYLEREIFQFGRRIPTETLDRFWTMLAHSQGSLLNASKLASGLAVSAPTVAGYVDLLADLLLVRRLPPFRLNIKKRLVKSPKVYVRDSGLVHALLGIGDLDSLAGHPVVGPSWEGFVVENVLACAPSGTRACFYRTSAGAEIDLVLEIPGQRGLWAVEIKRGLSVSLGKGFRHALEDLRPERTFVVYAGDARYPIGEGIEVISLRKMAALLDGPRRTAGL